MDINGSSQKYGSNIGTLSAILETSWNQNGFGQHSAKTIGIGAEALSLLIIGLVGII